MSNMIREELEHISMLIDVQSSLPTAANKARIMQLIDQYTQAKVDEVALLAKIVVRESIKNSLVKRMPKEPVMPSNLSDKEAVRDYNRKTSAYLITVQPYDILFNENAEELHKLKSQLSDIKKE